MACRLTTFDRVYLDLDGPLVDCRERHHRLFRDLLVEDGADPSRLSGVDEFWARKRKGATTLELARAHRPSTDLESLRRRWLERIEAETYLSLDRLQPLAREALDRLRTGVGELHLITARASRERLGWQLARLAIDAVFDSIIVCPPGRGIGTKHESLRRSLDGFAGSACLVGDSEMDMSAAVACGRLALGVDCGIREAPALLAAGAREVRPCLASYLDPTG